MLTATSQPNAKRVDLRDREHFRVHLAGHDDRLFIGKPLLGKTSGKWSVQLTRRIDDAQRRFAGVVVLSLSPDDFGAFFDANPAGQGAPDGGEVDFF